MKQPKKEYVRVEKRVLANAIQMFGELGTGTVPLKTVSMVISELQDAHEGAPLAVVQGDAAE